MLCIVVLFVLSVIDICAVIDLLLGLVCLWFGLVVCLCLWCFGFAASVFSFASYLLVTCLLCLVWVRLCCLF